MLGHIKDLLPQAAPDTRPLKRWALVEPWLRIILERPECPKDPGTWEQIDAGPQYGDRRVNGAWVAAEKSPEFVRAHCQALLDASDRRVTRAMVEKRDEFVAELETYREALREIRRSGVAPDAWPTPPQYQPQEV